MRICFPLSSATRIAGFLVISSVLIMPSHGLVVRGFSEDAHLRMNGFPSSPSINPTFLNPSGEADSRLDLTGVGWSVQAPTKQFTLVSPRHFVGANHFRPAVGSDVRFLAKDGALHTFKVATIRAIPNANGRESDLFLGEFTSELSEAVPVLPLPYLNLATEGAYVGESLVVVGQAARGGRGVISAVQEFGGDNTVNSRFFPNGEDDTALLPRFAVSPHRLLFIRRTDADERGLSYVIETSTTLESEAWQVVEDAAISIISNPRTGFEEVSAALPPTAAQKRFYRMRIELNE